LNPLINLWWYLVERSGLRAGFATEYANDLPDMLAPALLDLIGDRPRPWAAAMLYACGQHINLSAYHKHSWYLIRHGELFGYSESEHLMVAAIARYHRRSLPKERHEAWQCLATRDQRHCVVGMALLLRLAAALDRRPEPVVASLQTRALRGHLLVTLIPETPNQNLSLERWSLESCASQVKEAANVSLEVRAMDDHSL